MTTVSRKTGRQQLLWLSVLVSGSLLMSGCREKILHDLEELQANQVKVVLASSGIDSVKLRIGPLWSVAVEKSQATRALTAIEQSRVLKRSLRRLTERSKLFVRSREERQQLLERQLARTLEDSLESMPDVLEAHVHLHLESGESLMLGPGHDQKSASVLMIVRKADILDKVRIQALVSGASGVSAEAVAVVVERGDSAGSIEKAPAPGPSAQKRQMEVVELDVESIRKISAGLLPVLAVALLLSVRRRRSKGRTCSRTPRLKHSDSEITPKGKSPETSPTRVRLNPAGARQKAGANGVSQEKLVRTLSSHEVF